MKRSLFYVLAILLCAPIAYAQFTPGGSSGGGGGAPTDAPYITSTAVGGLSAEVPLSGLSTGCMGVTTTTGALASRTITGTSNEISVANGDCSGNPTLSLPSTINLSSKTLRIPNSTTLPATCTVGDSYMDTDATSGQRFYLCQSANTWALQGDGGSGGTNALLDGTAHTDTLAGTVVAGDLIVGNSTPKWSRFAKCTDGQIITWASGLVACGTINAAPTTSKYLLQTADAALPNAQAMGALGTGLVFNTTTTGVQSIYAGATCTSQVVRVLSAAGAATCVTITSAYVDSTVAVTNASNSWAAGVKQTFAPNGTTAGLNVGSVAGDPSTPANGDKWYDSTGNKFRCRENGVSVNCIGGGTTYTFRDNLLNSSSTIDWQPDPTVVWINEEFCGGGTASGSVASYGWKATDVVGTGSFNTPSGSLPNLCQWYVLSGATSGNVSAMSLHDLGNNGAGTLGDHTGTLPWEANLVFKMGQTATTAQWIGLVNNSALSITPADFIGVRWDTTLDTTNFSFVCRAAGVETGNKTDTTIAADTTFHRIRIYSSVANQINFELYSSTGTLQKQSLNACTTTANIPTASLTLAFQSGTRAASGAQLNADFASYKRRVAR